MSINNFYLANSEIIANNPLGENYIDEGRLRVRVTGEDNRPIGNASILVFSAGNVVNPILELRTDSSGLTDWIELPTPPVELSLDETNIIQPYSEYSVLVSAEGFEEKDINGIEIFAGTDSEEPVVLVRRTEENAGSEIVIPAHTLYGNYPEKIKESEIKDITETGEIVLSRVVVPEIIVVHDGTPNDSTAKDYYVNYRDYIKNVASSEIYATWPESTIVANVLAIMSFTLNRVYTEW